MDGAVNCSNGVSAGDFSGTGSVRRLGSLFTDMGGNSGSTGCVNLREKLFTFEVDILRNDVCDISLNLQLTERVLVSTDGTVSSVEAVAEPDEPEEMWTVKRG